MILQSLWFGYQVSFEAALEAGYLLFNHSCGSTLAVPVKKIKNLPERPVAVASVAGEGKMQECCLHEDGEPACPEGCQCASVKEIMRIISSWPKKLPVPVG